VATWAASFHKLDDSATGMRFTPPGVRKVPGSGLDVLVGLMSWPYGHRTAKIAREEASMSTDQVSTDQVSADQVPADQVSANPVLWDLDQRGVATVTLNRPEVNNAYDAGLIGGVLAAMDELGGRPSLRVVVLKGNGRHFQAGADLKWINSVRPKSAVENETVSRATFEAVQRLNRLPIPTVALVQGGCFGGGTGVISACDVVIAADNALFSITEVRWGLTAAIIIPQLCDAIGVRQVRRYALTGERFGAEEARRIGLVHEVVPLAELESAGAKVVEQLLANGPDAMAETKRLAMESSFGGMSVDDAAYARLVRMHSERRQTAEASEGLASFAEKRAAHWVNRA
jgi:methylglutaconyl-CoA hydratase